MKIAYLHAGHSKTGSSFIQALLAMNADSLSTQGVVYPLGRNTIAAQRGEISAGNLDLIDLKRKTGSSRSVLNSQRNIAFSSEYMFPELSKDTALLEYFKTYGFQPKVLVLTRNPLEHMISGYSQAVKRERFFGTIEDFFDSRHYSLQHPFEIEKVIENCRQTGADLTIRCYEDEKSDLTTMIAKFLGVEPCDFVSSNITVNRSLSSTEIEYIRILASALGAGIAQKISDNLCNKLRNIKVDRIVPDASVIDKFSKNVLPQVEKLRRKYGESYTLYPHLLGRVPSLGELHSTTQLKTPTEAQLRVISESILEGMPIRDLLRPRLRYFARRLAHKLRRK